MRMPYPRLPTLSFMVGYASLIAACGQAGESESPAPRLTEPTPAAEVTPEPTPASAEPEVTRTVTYTGRVVCEDGEGVPSATVAAYDHYPEYCEATYCDLEDPDTLAVTQTDGEGGFLLEVTAAVPSITPIWLFAEPTKASGTILYCGNGHNVAMTPVGLEDKDDVVLVISVFQS